MTKTWIWARPSRKSDGSTKRNICGTSTFTVFFKYILLAYSISLPHTPIFLLLLAKSYKQAKCLYYPSYSSFSHTGKRKSKASLHSLLVKYHELL